MITNSNKLGKSANSRMPGPIGIKQCANFKDELNAKLVRAMLKERDKLRVTVMETKH